MLMRRAGRAAHPFIVSPPHGVSASIDTTPRLRELERVLATTANRRSLSSSSKKNTSSTATNASNPNELKRAGSSFVPNAVRGGSSSQPSPESIMRSVETAVNDIIYGSPPVDVSSTERHILSVLVDNEPGVLSKISGLLSARGFNIESLSVASTDVNDLSRMTIVLNCPVSQMYNAKRQLEDVVNVWAVLELQPEAAVEREIIICKIDTVPLVERRKRHQIAEQQQRREATGGSSAAVYKPTQDEVMARHNKRRAAMDIVTLFEGRIINVGTEHIIAEVVGPVSKVDAFLSLLRPLGLIEAVRSGALAMSKSVVTGIYDDSKLEEREALDDSTLPPG